MGGSFSPPRSFQLARLALRMTSGNRQWTAPSADYALVSGNNSFWSANNGRRPSNGSGPSGNNAVRSAKNSPWSGNNAVRRSTGSGPSANNSPVSGNNSFLSENDGWLRGCEKIRPTHGRTQTNTDLHGPVGRESAPRPCKSVFVRACPWIFSQPLRARYARNHRARINRPSRARTPSCGGFFSRSPSLSSMPVSRRRAASRQKMDARR